MHPAPSFGGPARNQRFFCQTSPCRTRDEVFRTLTRRGISLWRITGVPGRWITWFRLRRSKDTLDPHELSAWRGIHRPLREKPAPTSPPPPETPDTRPITFPRRWYDKMANLLKKMGIPMVAGLLATSKADGATLVVAQPVDLGSAIGLGATATNDDNGAIYNSNDYNVFATVGSQLHELPVNSSYSSQDALMNDWIRGVGGQADNNWSLNVEPGTYSLVATHAPGIPNVTYDQMSFGINQEAIVRVPKFQLETNGISGYQGFTLEAAASASFNPDDYDATIFRSDSAIFDLASYQGPAFDKYIDNAFVGTSADDFSNWSTSAPQYVLVSPTDFSQVPEPSTGLIVGLGALGLAMRRDRKQAETHYNKKE